MTREQPERPIFGPEDSRLDPPNPPEIRPARSVLKAISWRVVGTLDTLVLSFVILSFLAPLFGLEEASTADRVRTAAAIALTEVATKMTLYYLHERLWSRLHWDRTLDEEGHYRDGRRRSATKTGDVAGVGERGHHGARIRLHWQSGDSDIDRRVRGHHEAGALFLPRALLGADPLGSHPGECMRSRCAGGWSHPGSWRSHSRSVVTKWLPGIGRRWIRDQHLHW